MNILSIQSWVAFGHVGNASAAFPLQRLGAEVWAVHTVQFSNHLGYGRFRGQVFTGEQVAALVEGIDDLGVLPSCDAVISGYIGDAGIGAAVLDAVARVKRANPRAVYCCDPVIGDAGAVYVRPGIPEFLRHQALARADIATPNHFELEHLTGMPVRTLADARGAITALRATGPATVLVTSLRTDSTPDDALDMLVGEADGFFLVRTPLLPASFSGSGDVTAALFLFHRLRTGSAVAALEAAAAAVHGLLSRTVEAGSAEILTIAAQEEFVRPSRWFTAIPC
jgi:pyridoxine kinase